jgi:hypothetical protein
VRRRPRIDLRHESRPRDPFDKINEPGVLHVATGGMSSIGTAKVFAAAKAGEGSEEDAL